MKNIYSQLVVTFIIVVAASFLITLLMSDWIFQRQQVNFVQDRILSDAEAMAEIQASIPANLMQKYLNSQGGQTQLVVIGADGSEYRSQGNGPGGPLGISPPPLPLGGNDSSSSNDSSNNSNSSANETDENTSSASDSSQKAANSTTDTDTNASDAEAANTNGTKTSSESTSSSSTAASSASGQAESADSSSATGKKKPPPPPPPPPPKKEADWVIPESVQQLVLSGQTYHPQTGTNPSDPDLPSLNLSLNTSDEDQEPRYVGVPFERDGIHYALFARPSAGHFVNQFNQWMFLVLLVMLMIGVILFLFAARLIARPIAKLSDATRRVAKGDYDVRVHLKRKDEIGQLSDNFNLMTTRLSKIEAMRQEFVSNVSHEIQTPLTSIRGFAVALKDTASSEQLKHLKIIEQESERLSKLSSNLLKLASLDVVKLNKHQYRLDEQIRMAVVSCGPMWMNKEIELSAELDKLDINGDEDLLTQVWMNLLSNAIKFTPEKGTIHITLTEQEQWIKASVQDSGCGIDAEHVEHIFERFYKADSSRNSATGGSGLGLSIVQKILLLHDGRIEAHSAQGQGTTMTVYLPRTAAAVSTVADTPPKAVSH
ncbi:HAMP domain-containing sensor histidine kinase [Paenibacillus campi]|uniref:sensor histidine kinase n=1 Tax=Paenibacillus campi TaxID=3106031 RepID=UPI002AFFC888|nr:HAMP domain-containing sensor histidine kinase [Paenibacillus sp. SGZ-1009]